MKESTCLPEWNVLHSFLLLLLLLNKMRNLSDWNVAVNQCIYSNTSSVKKFLFSHTLKSMYSRCVFKADSPHGHKFRADPRRHGWMTLFTSRIPEPTPEDTDSMNWSLSGDITQKTQCILGSSPVLGVQRCKQHIAEHVLSLHYLKLYSLTWTDQQ